VDDPGIPTLSRARPAPARSRTRITRLLLAAALVGAPAVVLRSLCAGRSCERPAGAVAAAPFCSLPDALRARLFDGFRDGRSPEIVGVTGEVPVIGGEGFVARDGAPAWPSASSDAAPSLPLVFAGTGIDSTTTVRPGTTLDAVAPTVAEIIGLRRPHPEVRSGEAVEGVATGEAPRLVLEVVAKGLGSDELAEGPVVKRLLAGGAGTLDAHPGSLPLDPAAILTTIGTGGLPRQHGITGTLVRNDEGRLTRAWGGAAPVSVIAGLGDDLDERLGQRPKIALVADDRADRGLVGGNWYVDVDRDFLHISSDVVRGARRALARGLGRDRTPDLLGVTIDDTPRRIDAALGRLVSLANSASRRSLAVVVTATGEAPALRAPAVSARRVVTRVHKRLGTDGVVEAATPGGLFTDQQVLADGSISEDDVVGTLASMRGLAGDRLFADAFTGRAVTFARYC
jgi:hypothetical protein